MMPRITLFFEPLDVLQFRDHRPFDAGMHHVASSVFPRPTVLRGAVRTALFRALAARFESSDPYFDVPHAWARKWLGGREDPGELVLRGPLLARVSEQGIAPMFHAPHDLAWPQNSFELGENASKPGEQNPTGETAQILVPHRVNADLAPQRFRGRSGSTEEIATALPWTGTDIGKYARDDLLTEAGASAYLGAQAGTVNLGPLPDGTARRVPRTAVLQREERVGIARSPERLTASDRMIYTITPFRLAARVGFAVDITLPEEAGGEARSLLHGLDARRATLGGKGHRARIQVVDRPLPMLVDPFERPAVASSKPAKFWLQTPLPLKQANPPGLTLIAKRSEAVGGFDLQKGAPRALRAALPAGAVLHFAGSLSDLATDVDLRTGYGTALLVPPSHGVMS